MEKNTNFFITVLGKLFSPGTLELGSAGAWEHLFLSRNVGTREPKAKTEERRKAER